MKKKSLLLLVVALLTVFSLAGCSEKEEPASGSDTDMLTTALTNMAEAKSMTYAMDMTMTMSAEGQTLDMSTLSEIQFIMDPLTMKMNMSLSMAGVDELEDTGNMTTSSYMETVDGTAWMYMDAGDGTWYKQNLGDAAALQQYDVTQTIDAYVSTPEQFKSVGTEEVNGSEATKFEGVLSEDSLNDAINNSGVLSQMNLDGIDEATLQSMYEGMDDLAMTLWIDNETLLPVKYEMDMSDMMNTVMKNLMASTDETAAAQISVDKVFVTVEITGYDNVSAIEIPEEARNAEEMTVTE